MATRKRKSPKGRGRRKVGLISTGAAALGGAGLSGLAALGGLIARYPSIAGGVVAFIVIFSFVAANALWYQPGEHPSPFLRTRDPNSPAALAGQRFAAQHEPAAGNVTTFKIERPEDGGEVSTSAATAVAPAAAGAPRSQLVMDIQSELIRRGLYNGPADGVIGPRTSAAILFFEETVRMPQTGEATPELLAALRAGDNATTATIPVERPPEDVKSAANAVDPVAAAILAAEKDVKTVPPKKGIPADKTLANVDLVLQIQKGLSNIAYANVGVDGVMGEQTRTAIRQFQKHYRLPETGEPSVAVLKKLQEIGAL